MLHNITAENYSFWDFKGEVDYVDKWFLMSTPIPVLSIWIAYLAFVLKIGPEFMKKRPPFSLNNVLILYNVFQIMFSCFVFYVGYDLLQRNGLFLQRKCLSDSEDLKHYTAVGIYYYFFAKLTELFDTVFFVLRKKDRQVTFLHVYHHSITLLSSWGALKYEPSYSTIFLGTLNSFVHIVMYTYYGLSAFPDLTKYLWWKKYITTMQLIQFLLIVLQVVVNYKVSSCRPSYGLLLTMVLNATLFIFLFGDFYIKSYKNKSKIDNSTGTKTEIREKSKIKYTTVINNYKNKNN
ncbi:PREDICTED: elongation of very long chain fatty acids protein AAEL008004-like [Papilio xuthus]|uniref:Elongation of very long chain fatty acids protein n=2 Tax=Papilio xuthus TaxID=66420 RepID=A0AAJ6ZSD9_PAPXU|nr:PREDICTED: elongation of very long chain fatty acids protein AAEL008004-like [Papilio xuthus]XP_013178282.1 PREDICTED: elongation of very long chain fatty acids protein AAEL008004-like [Papilio xuthus]